MTETPDPRKERQVAARTGALLAILGGCCTALPFWLMPPRAGRSPFECVLFIGPTLLVGGVVIFVRNCFSCGGLWCCRNCIYTGLALIILASLPWAYGFLFPRAGEAAGMMGTLLFLIAGSPGVVLVLLGILLRLMGQE